MKLELNTDIMAVNHEYAAKNRELFRANRILSLNIMGSPGGGKTTLLERLLPAVCKELRPAVIEGDLATARDAQRIQACGAQAVQINTDGGCHLDASMIHRVLPVFELGETDLVIMENVGNLVCPSGFDLGEDLRIVVLSITEGADKPEKYPSAFLAANWVIMNKVDLLPYTDFDMDRATADLLRINPGLRIFHTACRPKAEQGIDDLADALLEAFREKARA